MSKMLRFVVPSLAAFFMAVSVQAQNLTVQVGSPPGPPTPFVNHNDTWFFHKGTNAPQANWQTIADGTLNADWGSGPGGFGYGDNGITNTPGATYESTLLPDMINRYTTFFIRRTFNVASAVDTNLHLLLTVDYDDGFVAYLDGAEIRRANTTNAVGSTVTYTQTTGANSHEASCCNAPVNAATTYDLGAVSNRLAVGTHILAIVGLNQASSSSDFHLIADLSLAGGTGANLSGAFGTLVTSNSVMLTGSNTVAGSTAVTVNGDEASFASSTWSRVQPLKPGLNRLYIAALDAAGNIRSNITTDVIFQTSATNLSGTLASSVLASNGGTVVYVTGNVTVPTNVTFEAANGAVVLVNPGVSMTTQNGGRILVHGTFDDRVYFRLNGATNLVWGPLSGTGTNASIELSLADVSHGQVNARDGAYGLVQDSDLHDFDPGAAAGTLGRPILNCNFASLFEVRRIHVWNYYECLVRNGIIHVEQCLFERMSGDALDFDSAQPGSYTRRCTYRHGDLGNVDAVDIGPSGDLPGCIDTRIEDSIMWDFPFDKGVSVGDDDSSHGIIVSNCLIYACLSGVMAKTMCEVSVRNCTIVENTSGFTNYNKATPASPTGGGITTNSYNNILWNNVTTIGLTNDSRLYADHNDFGNTNWPGTGNINVDPMFVNPATRNYRLQPGSPCLTAGRNGDYLGVTYPLGGIPAPPLRLAVIASGTNALALNWIDDSQNEDGVIVQRSTDATSWTALATLGPDATNHTDATAVLGQKYYYRVQHTNYVGVSPWSNMGSGTRQAPVVSVGGTISGTVTWNFGSHYIVTGAVTVASGATLTIDPGVIVCFNTGLGMAIANGGRLLAVGTSNAPILFTRSPSNATTWTGLTISGAVGSPETQIAHARFEFTSQNPCLQVSAGTVYFDHLTFGNTAAAYIHVDGASFVIQDCEFPNATAQFELVHGTGGIKSGGHGVLVRNFFGKPIGYNDVVDFTGGNRPGPIIHFIDNVFAGASDDQLDLDGTDAWVEGNIFLHAHKNGSPDTSSAVSGGDDSGSVSDITVIGNIMYDVDQAAMAKGGNFFTLINNTIVHQTKTGGTDTDGAVIALADEGFGPAVGMYLEANIIYDAEKLVRFYTNQAVTFTNNLFPTNLTWSGAGGNNGANDPQLTYLPQLSETFFTNWASAQIMKQWFQPASNSPALGTGPNGRDQGGVIPVGASIAGEPSGTTSQSNATLAVGVLRTGSGIPNGAANFPLGSGYTHYKWRLDGGAWSAETPIGTAIALNNLLTGPHYVEVSGKRDSALYQDDPLFGVEAAVTRSRTWTVGSGSVDTDGDGMPDDWEDAHGLNKLVNDAAADADGDGMTNLQEYLAGTDPQDAASRLWLQGIPVSGNLAFRFTAVPNKSYTVQYRTSLNATSSWQPLLHYTAVMTNRSIAVTNSPLNPLRFYRVVTPLTP